VERFELILFATVVFLLLLQNFHILMKCFLLLLRVVKHLYRVINVDHDVTILVLLARDRRRSFFFNGNDFFYWFFFGLLLLGLYVETVQEHFVKLFIIGLFVQRFYLHRSKVL
jgi:hypothetical protein